MSSYSRRSRYLRSPSLYERDSRSYSRSISSSRSRSRSRSRDSSEIENPGNNLYVTGLSPRITKRELEKHFSSEGGKVIDVHLVVDPRTKESRGFGFVTMSTVEEAQRCLKYLDRSVLEGRVITVEKAKRRRGRTPTPGRYLGLKSIHVRRRTPSYSPYRRGRSSSSGYSSERERDSANSPYHVRARYRSWSRSPDGMSPVHRWSNSPYYRRRDRSYSPCYRRRDRSYSPYYRGRDRSYSPYYRGRDRSYSPYYRGRDHSYSPYYKGHDRSYSPYYRGSDCSYSPYYRGRSPYSPYYRGRDRSYSSYRGGRKRSYSPYDRLDRSVSPYDRRRSRAHSKSMSPRTRRRRHYKRLPTPSRSYSSQSYSRSQSMSSVASSVPLKESRSVTPSS